MLNKDHNAKIWEKIRGRILSILKLILDDARYIRQADRIQTKLTPELLSTINLLKAMNMSKNISIIESIILWVIL